MKKMYEEESIRDIADAIREQNGTQNSYTIAQMANAIRAIKTQPDLEVLNATENGNYLPSAGKDGFSSVSVNVEGGGSSDIHEGYIIGSTNPDNSIGTNGNVYLKYDMEPDGIISKFIESDIHGSAGGSQMQYIPKSTYAVHGTDAIEIALKLPSQIQSPIYDNSSEGLDSRVTSKAYIMSVMSSPGAYRGFIALSCSNESAEKLVVEYSPDNATSPTRYIINDYSRSNLTTNIVVKISNGQLFVNDRLVATLLDESQLHDEVLNNLVLQGLGCGRGYGRTINNTVIYYAKIWDKNGNLVRHFVPTFDQSVDASTLSGSYAELVSGTGHYVDLVTGEDAIAVGGSYQNKFYFIPAHKSMKLYLKESGVWKPFGHI